MKLQNISKQSDQREEDQGLSPNDLRFVKTLRERGRFCAIKIDINGVVHKDCAKCGAMFPMNDQWWWKSKTNCGGFSSFCKKCQRRVHKIWDNGHPMYFQTTKKRSRMLWRKKNRTRLNLYMRQYRKRSPEIYLRFCLSDRIRKVLSRFFIKTNTEELLGCSLSEFKKHIEQQFTNGMSWTNKGKWHLDHIRPCSSFDLANNKEIKACFHFSNIKPMWAVDNCKKGSM